MKSNGKQLMIMKYTYRKYLVYLNLNLNLKLNKKDKKENRIKQNKKKTYIETSSMIELGRLDQQEKTDEKKMCHFFS